MTSHGQKNSVCATKIRLLLPFFEAKGGWISAQLEERKQKKTSQYEQTTDKEPFSGAKVN